MNKTLLTIIIAILPLWGIAKEKQPAFPGAEGYGRYTSGGRGGKVFHVTNLNDSGTGSLRWAIDQTGARTIVFDVSGTIFLHSALTIKNANVTIAGQTAPGDGICVADYPVNISANNVIVRYMRFRLGNNNVTVNGADGWDGFGAMDHENIIIDHCSVSWSIDECLSVLGNRNTTVQWCISSHSLVNAGHSKGAHGYGGNWGGDHASFHHNLIAHHVSRTPRLGPRPSTQLSEHMDMRNNVIYNWAGNGCYGGEGMNVNIVNNYYKPGPATRTRNTNIQQRIAGVGVRTNEYVTTYPAYAPALHLWGHFYLKGNVNSSFANVTQDNWTYGFYNQIDASEQDGTYTQVTKDSIKLTEPLDFIHTTTHTAEVAYQRVLDFAGCSLSRDSYDDEVTEDARLGKASHTGSGLNSGHINSQNDLKPAGAGADWSAWPTLNSTSAPQDTDGDGMPDAYESANGLNPNSATDGSLTAENGYTNLENYLNALVADITDAQNEGGHAEGGIEEENLTPASEFEISAQTSNGDGTFSTGGITFKCNYSDLSATTGGYYMKFSRNRDYSFAIPDNMAVTQVRIDGYCNGDNNTGYVWKVGTLTLGNKGEANDYVMPARNLPDHVREYTFNLATPVKKSLLIACTGENQCAMRVVFSASIADGITTVYKPTTYSATYNMQGQRVSQAKKGILIRNGKKFIND